MGVLAIGIVTVPFGVAGWCKVKSFSGETGHFLGLKEVCIRFGGSDRNLAVEEVKASGSLVLVKFAGINTPEEARKLSGAELLVERAFGQKLEHGEYYINDLCMCALFCHNERVGQVTGMIEGGPALLLEVRKDDGTTVLIPFIGKFIGGVDLPNLRIELTEDFLLS
ncbi:MAG: 16S rRNA processing protein RimM [Spirochaetaceae bacterium]|nr:MAG: 16S rRNA processing protein RimM [Spirochaetaceae bacterium]